MRQGIAPGQGAVPEDATHSMLSGGARPLAWWALCGGNEGRDEADEEILMVKRKLPEVLRIRAECRRAEGVKPFQKETSSQSRAIEACVIRKSKKK
jgi:hypothetical protein